MNLKGKTLLVDLYGCNEETMQDVDKHYKMLVELPMKIGMNPIAAPQIARWDVPQAKVKEAWGYSGTILFAESHAYFHSWPEYGYIMFDLTSCKDFDHEMVVQNLFTLFNAQKVDFRIEMRGLLFE